MNTITTHYTLWVCMCMRVCVTYMCAIAVRRLATTSTVCGSSVGAIGKCRWRIWRCR